MDFPKNSENPRFAQPVFSLISARKAKNPYTPCNHFRFFAGRGVIAYKIVKQVLAHYSISRMRLRVNWHWQDFVFVWILSRGLSINLSPFCFEITTILR